MPAATTFLLAGMDNVTNPVSVGAPGEGSAYTQLTDIVNLDVYRSGALVRRGSLTPVAEGAVTSFWSNGSTAYAAIGGALHTFDGETLTTIAESLQDRVEFCQVNDVIFFSDDATCGIIDADGVTVVSNPLQESEISDFEAWVAATYPAGFDAGTPNFEVDAFKVATHAGRCLEFAGGTLYLAVDNFVFRTRTFDVEHMDLRFSAVAGFAKPVTMIKAVEGGLLVGTEGEVAFVDLSNYRQGGATAHASGEMSQNAVLAHGVVYGSAVTADAEHIPPLKTQGQAAVFTTPVGVFAGYAGGKVVNLSGGRVQIPAGNSAAALLRKLPDGSWQYLVNIGSDTIAVNLATAAHSRYTLLQASGFGVLGGECFVAGAAGIQRLSGSDDVPWSFTTPAADFTLDQLKRCPDLYLHAKADGEVTATLFVDESEVEGEYPFATRERAGTQARQYRAKLPKGAEGTHWQFTVSGVAPVTAYTLRAAPTILSRTI